MKNFLVIILMMVVLTTALSAQELKAPEAGKAKVYIFNFQGSIIGRNPMKLFLDQKYIGVLNSSMFYGIDLEPGEYVLWGFNGGKKWFLKLNVAGDKTYYVHLLPTTPKMNPNPVPSPVLYNACPNHKKGKKRYSAIVKRLEKDKFVEELANTPEAIQEGQEKRSNLIKEVWEKWENEWKNSKKWGVISPEDGN